MKEHYSTPDDDREYVPVDPWQDDETYLLAAAAEAEANYSYEEDA